MKIWKIFCRLLCIQPSINEDHSTFTSNDLKPLQLWRELRYLQRISSNIYAWISSLYQLLIVNMAVTNVEEWQIFIRRCYLATGFKTYKKFNNWCNCENVSGVDFSCGQWGRNERHVLNFLIQALLDVALFQLVKGDLPRGNNSYIFRIEEWKDNGILCEKIGKVCTLYRSVVRNFQTKEIFQIPPFNTISVSKCWDSY